jgi:hypothetical protein
MAFGWAYVNCTGSGGGGGGTGGASGPSGSIQFMTSSGTGVSSGSLSLTYDATLSYLTLTGTLAVSGTISASHYHIENVVEMDVSGNTFFGNTDDDVHARTGSLTMTNVSNDINFNVTSTGRTDLRQLTVEYTPVTSSPYTASHPAYILGVQASGQVYIQLPSPIGTTLSGNVIMVKDEQLTPRLGDNITLSTPAGTIDGSSTYILTGSNPAISLYSNGSNWFVF